VVPWGSCEQHGPHLPFDTDTVIASALASALAASRSGVVVSPAVAVGASGEHQSFPGTLSTGTEVTRAAAVELVRSALPPSDAELPRPFDAVLIVNGHGGNVEALDAAADQVVREGRRAAVWHPRVPGGDPHAGHTETSLMLHLAPGRVRMDLAAVGSTARFSQIAEVLRSDGLAAVAPNGVLGDPRTADPLHGADVFDQLMASLLESADRLHPGGTTPTGSRSVR